MSSSSAASDSETDRVTHFCRNAFGQFLPLSLRDRAYNIFWHQCVDELQRVRRWFVERFPPYIREYTMQFLNETAADDLAVLELEIHHLELTKARSRKVKPQPGHVLRTRLQEYINCMHRDAPPLYGQYYI